ncbi:NAD(P)H-binding protein [Lacticaseibacillus zhaodongensis]|uniref:NAD(P)H-binding protein n=1 Tax=Lacticaseibacillus zhaodongensis TaxID=2668065 RepID=UPI0012D34A06|nr:NAD(P)H-binding protein [Lacticaseibacillus zhaodongensis]
MTTYAVTGATGRFGQRAIKYLAAKVPASDIVALARNTDKAKKLLPTDITIRQADYNDAEQFTKALQGVDRLLFISSVPGGPVPRAQQHANVLAAAERAGVSFIAYTSFPHADQAEVALAADHKATEKAIAASGIKHSFLRNNWYLENELSRLQAAAAGKDFLYAAGDAKVGWALEREYAKAAANVLAATDTKDVYEFAGPARTYRELAAAIAGDFEIKSLSDADYQAALIAGGMPAKLAGFAAGGMQLIASGILTEDTTDLPDVLGHELTPLPEAIQEVLK